MNIVSPKYLMALIQEIEDRIWEVYSSYKTVRFYINKWHESSDDWNDNWENFQIHDKNTNGDIDLSSTLHSMDGETVIKIAIDLGLQTPDYIPAIPEFKNELKSNYKTAHSTLDKAFKQIEEHPDNAILLANSAMESVVKEMLKDERVKVKSKKGETLYNLTISLLKAIKLNPLKDMPIEIKTIGSSLLAISQSVEKIRSTKTLSHGKVDGDYVIDDKSYAYFTINSISTVTLFLASVYKSKFPNQESPQIENFLDADDDLPF